MNVRVQHRRGTASAGSSFIGAEGEFGYLTDQKRIVAYDGATAGGIPMARLDEVTDEVMRAIGNADFSFQVTDRLVVPSAIFTAPRIAALPAASSVAAGRTISFFDALPAINGANVVSVVRSGADTINGASSYALSTPRACWDFVSDGVSKWSVAGPAASDVASRPVGNIVATNVQAAIKELDARATTVGMTIIGLRPSISAANPTTHLDISAGVARDVSGSVDIVLAAGLTKRIDQNWAAGTGNGGLDTGARAAGVHYHIHLIRNPTSGAVDVLFSLSATAPVMPSGFTQRRRIHAFPTWIGGDLWPATWNGGWCSYKLTSYVHINLVDNSAVALRDVFVPKGLKMLAKLMVFAQDETPSAPIGHVCVSDPDVGVPVLGGDMFPGIAKFSRLGLFAEQEVIEWTDTNGRLYFVDTGSGAPKLSVYPKGFFDARDEYA